MQTLHQPQRITRRQPRAALPTPLTTTHLTFELDLPATHPIVAELHKLIRGWPEATGGVACGNYNPNCYSFRADEDTLTKLQFTLIRATRKHHVTYAIVWGR
jgi:hypothetical protein